MAVGFTVKRYLYTIGGEDFLDVFHSALAKAQQLQVPLRMQAL